MIVEHLSARSWNPDVLHSAFQMDSDAGWKRAARVIGFSFGISAMLSTMNLFGKMFEQRLGGSLMLLGIGSLEVITYAIGKTHSNPRYCRFSKSLAEYTAYGVALGLGHDCTNILFFQRINLRKEWHL